MELQLQEGQKIFNGVLVNFEEVQGKRKSDNKDFHFLKFSIDFTLKTKDNQSYSRVVELTADPGKFAGRHFVKYQPIAVILEMIDPIHAPTLIDAFQQNMNV